jgi:hypothetical protein
VFRGGVEIGRAAFTLKDTSRTITLHVLTMLEPSVVGPLDPASGKQIPRWLMISGQEENSYSTEQLLSVFDVPPDFLRKVATVVAPGTTLVVTQPAATTSTRTTVATDFTVVTSEAPPAHP